MGNRLRAVNSEPNFIAVRKLFETNTTLGQKSRVIFIHHYRSSNARARTGSSPQSRRRHYGWERTLGATAGFTADRGTSTRCLKRSTHDRRMRQTWSRPTDALLPVQRELEAPPKRTRLPDALARAIHDRRTSFDHETGYFCERDRSPRRNPRLGAPGNRQDHRNECFQ